MEEEKERLRTTGSPVSEREPKKTSPKEPEATGVWKSASMRSLFRGSIMQEGAVRRRFGRGERTEDGEGRRRVPRKGVAVAVGLPQGRGWAKAVESAGRGMLSLEVLRCVKSSIGL